MSRIGSAVRVASHERVAGERGPSPLAIDVEARNSAIDHDRLAADRLARFRAELARHDYGAAVLSDPINIRYVTGARNMAVWTMHAPGRYVFVPVDGPVVLFEFATSKHLSEGLDTIDEIRHGVSPFFFLAGPRSAEIAERWSRDIVALTLAHAGPDHRLAVDRCEPWLARHLYAAGITLFDAQEPAEVARTIKTPEEVECMQLAMDVCDVAVERLLRGAATRGDREPVVGGAARDEHRPRGRVDRMPSVVQRPADEPVVPGMREPGDRSRRPGRLRHRHGRPERLSRRHLATVLCPGARRPRTSDGSTTSRRSRSSRTST